MTETRSCDDGRIQSPTRDPAAPAGAFSLGGTFDYQPPARPATTTMTAVPDEDDRR